MHQHREAQRILFVHNRLQSFVAIDLEILKEKWEVDELYEVSLLKINPIKIYCSVRDCDLIFCWFASWHSFFPVLFAFLLRKPSIVVVGGYDTANVPEAGYGSQRGGIRKLIANLIIRLASQIVTNSESATQETIRNTPANIEKIKTIYHGVPLFELDNVKREPIILNVGSVWRENLARKGIRSFVESANLLPEYKFVHIGEWCDDSIDLLRSISSTNVSFLGRVSDTELKRWYQRVTVYVQPSLHEGFGMSVAEAMLGGCIPVVTRAGALPEVCGDLGIYVESQNPSDLAAAIRLAMTRSDISGNKIRESVAKRFPIHKRRDQLVGLINELI